MAFSSMSMAAPNCRQMISFQNVSMSRPSPLRPGPVELRNQSSLLRVLDELLEPLEPRLLPAGANHPPAGGLPVRGRLGLEERPRVLVPLEPLLVRLLELVAPMLVRIDARPVLGPRLERLQARGPHQPAP